MALIFADGFETTTTLPGKWDANNNGGNAINTSAVRNGSNGWNQTNTQGYLQKNLSAQTTFFSGWAMNVQTTTGTNGEVWALSDSGSNQITLRMDVTGHFAFYRNGTQLGGGFSTLSMSFTAWHYLEVKVVINGSTGIVELKVDGTFFIQLSSQNTQATGNASANAVYLGNPGAVLANTNGGGIATGFFDDFYLCDGSGSALNTYLGDMKVLLQQTTANGTTNNWAHTGGATNWQSVLTVPPNTADYVSDSTSGDIDEYTFGATTGSAVLAVMVTLYAEKDDVGTRSIRGYCKSSSTTADSGTDFALTQNSYKFYSGIFATDPNTSAAWGVTALNAAQFGVKLTA